MRVLVVEDEEKVSSALRSVLELEGYEVAVESTGTGAASRLEREAFDLILLDLTLPGRSGIDILRSLRRQGLTVPVLVVTARDTWADRVHGLDSGADDYLIKPFVFAELLARIRAIARRGRTVEPATRWRLADLELDLVTRKATRGGRLFELTAREFDLLAYLLRAEGQVVSRDSLAHDVWSESVRSISLDNVIDVHIARLRRKLDHEHDVKLIHTIRGVGFAAREVKP